MFRISNKRIEREFKNLSDLFTIVNEQHVLLKLPLLEGSRYGKVCHINIFLQKNYPFSPPSFYFQVPIFHPNVDLRGFLRLGNSDYTPAYTLNDLVYVLQTLLLEPNLDCPVNPLATETWFTEDFDIHKTNFDEQFLN